VARRTILILAFHLVQVHAYEITSERMKITILTPQAKGGVRDFSEILVSKLNDQADCLVLSKDTKDCLRAAETDGCLYLQYSGYGYQGRGVPLWLVQELKATRNRIHKLGIYFHELYAFGPPWKSEFWLSPLQRYIAYRLAELADFWVTNRGESARHLKRYSHNKCHAVLPVFSNVGEASSYLPQRARKLVVFGGAELRRATYRRAGRGLFDWAKQCCMEMHDIGPELMDKELRKDLEERNVIVHGRMSTFDVGIVMQNAMFGLLAYPASFIGKSGVFAAYCAYGICPLLISDDVDEFDGCSAFVHYYPGLPNLSDFKEFSTIGVRAWEWYQKHSLSIHVSTVQELVGTPNV
jgi:hypothetical protein